MIMVMAQCAKEAKMVEIRERNPVSIKLSLSDVRLNGAHFVYVLRALISHRSTVELVANINPRLPGAKVLASLMVAGQDIDGMSQDAWVGAGLLGWSPDGIKEEVLKYIRTNATNRDWLDDDFRG